MPGHFGLGGQERLPGGGDTSTGTGPGPEAPAKLLNLGGKCVKGRGGSRGKARAHLDERTQLVTFLSSRTVTGVLGHPTPGGSRICSWHSGQGVMPSCLVHLW